MADDYGQMLLCHYLSSLCRTKIRTLKEDIHYLGLRDSFAVGFSKMIRDRIQ